MRHRFSYSHLPLLRLEFASKSSTYSVFNINTDPAISRLMEKVACFLNEYWQGWNANLCWQGWWVLYLLRWKWLRFPGYNAHNRPNHLCREKTQAHHQIILFIYLRTTRSRPLKSTVWFSLGSLIIPGFIFLFFKLNGKKTVFQNCGPKFLAVITLAIGVCHVLVCPASIPLERWISAPQSGEKAWPLHKGLSFFE